MEKSLLIKMEEPSVLKLRMMIRRRVPGDDQADLVVFAVLLVLAAGADRTGALSAVLGDSAAVPHPGNRSGRGAGAGIRGDLPAGEGFAAGVTLLRVSRLFRLRGGSCGSTSFCLCLHRHPRARLRGGEGGRRHGKFQKFKLDGDCFCIRMLT